MNVTYRRDMDRSFMVIEQEDAPERMFMIRMLEKNSPKGFLRLGTRRMNGKLQLLYDITSLQSIRQMYQHRGMRSEEIRGLFLQLLLSAQECGKYLLDPADLILDPEMIYRGHGPDSSRFCCLPGYGAENEKSRVLLAEYLLKKLDHSDPEAVELGYAFFELAGEENASLAALLTQTLKKGEVITRGKSGKQGDGPEPASGSGPKRAPEEIWPEGTDRMSGRIRLDKTERASGRMPDGDEDFLDWETAFLDQAGSGRGSRIAWPFYAAGAAGLGLAFGLISWLGKLDLTQMGGLFFLLASVFWLVIRTLRGGGRQDRTARSVMGDTEERDRAERVGGKRDRAERVGKKKDRAERVGGKRDRAEKDRAEKDRGKRDREEDDEASFLEALMREEPWENSQESVDKGISGNKSQAIFREQGMPVQEMSWSQGTFSHREMSPLEDGETRFLEGPGQRSVWLISQDPRRCRDLEAVHDAVLIGKRQQEVDLWIGLDVISGLHARLEHTSGSAGEECSASLTDLNSTNGTYINGVRLQPYETRPIREGDRVAFATVQFKVRMG